MTHVPVSMTCDALGEMVESCNGSAYNQQLISPVGKLSLGNGQNDPTPFRAPLPGGATAHGGSSLVSFERKDHLGSVPLVLTKGMREMSSARQFAP
jgi:hypothetical protein